MADRVAKIRGLSQLIVASNPAKAALDGLDLLLRLVGNILKDQTNEKFRTLKKTIPKIKSTLFTLKGDVD